MILQQLEKLGAPHERQLHDLAAAVADVPSVLGFDERPRVQQAADGGVESPGPVLVRMLCLPAAKVNAVLDANARVNDREQRRRNSNEGDASPVQTGRHAGNVEKDPTPNCQERFSALELVEAQGIDQGRDGLGGFVDFFAIDEVDCQGNGVEGEVGQNFLAKDFEHG